MRAVVEVNLTAITNNIALIKGETSAEILAVVKADAYGHGLIPVAKCAIQSGATWLGVALIEEALTLRQSGVTAPLIAWLTPPSADFKAAINSNIDLSIPSLRHLELVVAAGKAIGKTPRVHIEVDTGMSRGGLLGEWQEFLIAIKGADVEVIGFWSHFARADEPDEIANKKQLQEFEAKLTELREHGINPKYVHFANSAATLMNPNSHNDIIRLGISMYGLSPDVKTLGSSQSLNLKPAMTLKAEVHLVKRVPAGSPVGYGGTEKTSRDTKLAIITMGYSDGIPRNTTSAAGVFVAGAKAPIIGRVSMDQFVVDLGPDSDAKTGDIAEIFGPLGYSIDDWAEAAGTINYEMVTRIATRVPRIYA
ncbi:MAG: alanine racemase [Actinomycetales bacterium]|nr:MAG: alanine racemase [Actinomycetales bacterium]